MSILSFSNVPFTKHMAPSLSAVDRPMRCRTGYVVGNVLCLRSKVREPYSRGKGRCLLRVQSDIKIPDRWGS